MKDRLSRLSARVVLALLIALPCFLSGCRFRARATVNTQSASLANNLRGRRSGLATMGLNLQIYIARQRSRAMGVRIARARRSAAAMRQQVAAAAESAAESARQAAREEMNKDGETEDNSCDPPRSPS